MCNNPHSKFILVLLWLDMAMPNPKIAMTWVGFPRYVSWEWQDHGSHGNGLAHKVEIDPYQSTWLNIPS